jgi:hypothetical protein
MPRRFSKRSANFLAGLFFVQTHHAITLLINAAVLSATPATCR